jgi:D-aminopeptidase
MLPNPEISPLFKATAEATEEAIGNAICMATTDGRESRVSHAMPLDRLREVGRNHRPNG